MKPEPELAPAPTLEARLPHCGDAELALLLDFFDGPTTPATLRRNFKSFVTRVRAEVRRREAPAIELLKERWKTHCRICDARLVRGHCPVSGVHEARR